MPNFVWIDLEMTGLDPQKDVILEMAVVITDANINVIQQYDPITISHDLDTLTFNFSKKKYKELLGAFKASGLLDRVKNSTTNIEDAEELLFQMLKEHCIKKECYLAGNSVWNDANFLIKYMPKVWNFLHYRLLDVSSLRLLRESWYPQVSKFQKKDLHDAMADVLESIEQLKYQREQLFRPASTSS